MSLLKCRQSSDQKSLLHAVFIDRRTCLEIMCQCVVVHTDTPKHWDPAHCDAAVSQKLNDAGCQLFSVGRSVTLHHDDQASYIDMTGTFLQDRLEAVACGAEKVLVDGLLQAHPRYAASELDVPKKNLPKKKDSEYQDEGRARRFSGARRLGNGFAFSLAFFVVLRAIYEALPACAKHPFLLRWINSCAISGPNKTFNASIVEALIRNRELNDTNDDRTG